MTPQYPTAPPPAPPAPARQAQTQTAAPQAPPRTAPQAPPPHTPSVTPATPAGAQAPARPGHLGTPAGGPPSGGTRWADAQRANAGANPAPNQRAQVLEDLRQKMHQFVISELGPILYDQRVSEADLRKQVEEQLHKALSQERHALTGPERQSLVQSVFDDVLGYGPIDRLLRDPSITEVMVNGPQMVYVERNGKLQLSDVQFVDETHVRRIIDKIVSQVGRRVDEATPMVDARLPDGSRVNCIIHPLAIGGPFMTIRRFSADPYTIQDLIGFGSISPQAAQFIDACVRGRLNVVVSGGTGTGKTTMLNVLSSFIPEDERIVTIEDAKELQLQQPHVLCLEARPPNIEGKGEVKIRDLVRNALRMRPDRVVVGECRGAEALDMLQAMNTGHDGSITTIHSNSPRDTLSRVETMTLMAGMELPVRVIREQMASALDLIVHLSRLRDGTRRITHISEVMGMEGDVIVLQDLYMFDYGMGIDENGRFLGELKSTGIRPGFTERLANNGVTLDSALFALANSGGFARRGGARR
jgi:pilus assembly protein CpaF